MKKTKFVTLGATALLAVVLLAGCGSDSKEKDASSSSTATSSSTTASSEKAEAFTGATAGTDNFEALEKGFASNGAWLNALKADVDASGKTLKVDGSFKNAKGEEAREVALYAAGSDHLPTATYTLTVEKVEVNSPGFIIAQGTVKGDVYVNEPGFHFMGTGKVEGNLIFKTEELKTEFEKLAKQPTDEKEAQKDASNQGMVTGEVKVG